MTTPATGQGSTPVDPAIADGGTPQGTITQKELHAAIEKARLEERDKLRKTIDSQKESLDKLTQERDQLQAQSEKAATDFTALTEQLNALKSSVKPEGGIDVEKAIQQAVQAAEQRIGAHNQIRITNLEKQLGEESKTRKQLALNQLRADLIKEAGGDSVLIPELVMGSDENELRMSIDRSKEVYSRHIANIAQRASSNPPTDGQQAFIPPATASHPLPQLDRAPNLPTSQSTGSFRRPLNDYAQNRERLRKEAAARYTSQTLGT